MLISRKKLRPQRILKGDFLINKTQKIGVLIGLKPKAKQQKKGFTWRQGRSGNFAVLVYEMFLLPPPYKGRAGVGFKAKRGVPSVGNLPSIFVRKYIDNIQQDELSKRIEAVSGGDAL